MSLVLENINNNRASEIAEKIAKNWSERVEGAWGEASPPVSSCFFLLTPVSCLGYFARSCDYLERDCQQSSKYFLIIVQSGKIFKRRVRFRVAVKCGWLGVISHERLMACDTTKKVSEDRLQGLEIQTSQTSPRFQLTVPVSEHKDDQCHLSDNNVIVGAMKTKRCIQNLITVIK